LQAALVAISNFDGSILAMVGGNNFKYEKFNRATQSLRSPGSTFKAFVYTTALDNGYDLESRLLDIPVVYEYATKEGTKVWIPENYEEDYVGETTLKYACAHSRNVATIDLLNKIGIEKAVKYARAFGLKGRIPQVPAIAIGGGCETTVLEMAASYSVFPNQGYLKKPHYLEKIINRQTKEIIYQNNYEETKAIDELTANKMTELLESVVKEGTGKSIINIYQFNQPCAGKTGTTNNSADTWFIGYTPYITTAVWVGYDNNSSVGNKETGATSALPIWAQFMKKTHENLPYRDFDFRTNNDGLIKDANYSNQNEGLENNNAMENSENKDNPENNIDDTAAQNNYDNANSE
jgi:penicillin-binding protein 1A